MLNSRPSVSTSRARAAYSDSRWLVNGDAVGAGLVAATPFEAVARSLSWALAGMAERPAQSKANRTGAWVRDVMWHAPEMQSIGIKKGPAANGRHRAQL